MARPTVIGITGTIGSGKSLVGSLLKARGYTVIDTDEVVHGLFSSDSELQRAITNRFGSQVLTGHDRIDRTKLAEIVFDNEEARKDLEAIVHPSVVQACQQLIGEHGNERLLFFLVPLLFEAGLEGRYDRIWAVTTEMSVLKDRLQKRTNLSEEELGKRIAAQLPQAEKAARAHDVIENSGDIEHTARQVDALLSALPV